MQRPPKGYDITNPMVNYLKHKSFIAEHKIADADLTKANFLKQLTDTFKAMQPLNDFLYESFK